MPAETTSRGKDAGAERQGQRKRAETERQRQEEVAEKQRQRQEAKKKADGKKKEHLIPPELLAQHCGCHAQVAEEFQQRHGFRMWQWAEACSSLTVLCRSTVRSETVSVRSSAKSEPRVRSRVQEETPEPSPAPQEVLLPAHQEVLLPFDPLLLPTEGSYQGGVIDWLGRRGCEGSWKNPHSTGQLAVSASSHSAGQLRELVVLKPGTLCTANEPEPWVMVHLGAAAVCATHFSLSGFAGAKSNLPMCWVLEGSIDGEQWIVLHWQQPNQAAFYAGQETGTWSIETGGEWFSCWRVRAVGLNSCGSWVLTVSGLELYGDLRVPAKQLDADRWCHKLSKVARPSTELPVAAGMPSHLDYNVSLDFTAVSGISGDNGKIGEKLLHGMALAVSVGGHERSTYRDWRRQFRIASLQLLPGATTAQSTVKVRLSPLDLPEASWIFQASIAWGNESLHELQLSEWIWESVAAEPLSATWRRINHCASSEASHSNVSVRQKSSADTTSLAGSNGDEVSDQFSSSWMTTTQAVNSCAYTRSRGHLGQSANSSGSFQTPYVPTAPEEVAKQLDGCTAVFEGSLKSPHSVASSHKLTKKALTKQTTKEAQLDLALLLQLTPNFPNGSKEEKMARRGMFKTGRTQRYQPHLFSPVTGERTVINGPKDVPPPMVGASGQDYGFPHNR